MAALVGKCCWEGVVGYKSPRKGKPQAITASSLITKGTLVQGGSGVLSEQRVGLGVIHGIPSASGDTEARGGLPRKECVAFGPRASQVSASQAADPHFVRAASRQPAMYVCVPVYVAPASAPCGLNASAESEPDTLSSASVSRAAPSGGGWRRCRPSAPRGEERGPAPHFLSGLQCWEGSFLLTPVSGLWSLREKATQFSWI
ncbi:unnamed protein product [Rangifer tarandus platyrhynchus]|uniref:Uncharacterized protein n=1 Tax=Rangifer tarandus platyrhynchus TaxID=3082113 RepID=A0ABN8YZB1_RANTA|nr:unnamed protein product [Rangifer tarandus platyrhynchus]